MTFFNNNFAGTSFDYPYFEDDSHFGSDALIVGPSRSQDWYLNPTPEGYTDRSGYQGSNLLDVSEYQFADPHVRYSNAYGSKSRYC